MKLKNNFALRQVAGSWVVIPLMDRSLDFTGILTLNDSGAMLWKCLEKGADLNALADALTAEYNVTHDVAMADAEEFLQKLNQADCIEK